MVAKRRARPPLPDESQELGLDGAKIAPPWPEDEGSELEERGTEAAEVEADKSGDAWPVRQAPAAAAPKPKQTPERGKKPSPPPPEDVGAKGSGEASPVRDAPPDELATAAPPPRKKSKIKKTTKRVKRPPPPSQEERAQDEVDGSGDPPPHKDVGADGSGEVSLVRHAPPNELATAAPPPCKKSKKTKQVKMARPSQEEHAQDEVDDSSYPLLMSNASANEAAATSSRPCIVMSPDHNKRGAMSPTRAKRGATPLLEEEEQAEKHAVGTNEDGTTEPLAKTGMPADKANQKKKKKKKLRKVSTKPAQPECAQLGLTGNRDEVSDALNVSSPQEKGSAQEEEHQGEMVERDQAGNISLPQVKDGAQEKEHQGEEVADQEHADNTSPPQVNDGIFEEEQQRKDVVEQENANKTSFPQQKDGTHEDEHTGVEVSGEALLERNASSHKLRTSEGKKKPAVERSWSQDDELKILTSLVEHAQSHRGALPDLSDLLANLAFDKTDANADKLNDNIRKLESRYRRFSSRGCPTDDLGRRLFELSHTLWGEVDDDVQLEATHGTRNFEQLSGLYPYLAKEVKVYAETHSSGDLIMAAFTTIGDEQARRLDAMCKKQRVDAFNLDLSQAILTNAVLSALSIQIN